MPKKNWEKAEFKVSKQIGGKRVLGSGNGRFSGDISTKALMIEMKETSKEPFTFHLNWLFKLINEASSEHKIPVFGIEFSGGEQRFLIRVKDINIVKFESEVSWINSSTVTLRPKDLIENTLINTKYGQWCVIELNVLKELAKENPF